MDSSLPAAEPRAQLEFLSRMADSLAAGVAKLPAFPRVVLDVQAAYKKPNYTPQLVARLISTEPPLARRLLDMANSAAFNATGRVIIDLGLALARLGAQKVYSVVLAHALHDIRRIETMRSVPGKLDGLWADSVAVAHFSQAVAARTSLPTDDAFAAGLLHLLGRFYIQWRCTEAGAPGSPIVLSDHLVDAWHPAIAKAVLRNWQMSEAVCEAVGAQADTEVVRTGSATLTDALVAGVRLGKLIRNRQEDVRLSGGGLLARLNLSIEECLRLVEEAGPDLRALERALRL